MSMEAARRPARRRRWPRRLLIAVFATAAVAAVAGFVVAPPIIRHVAESRLGAWLGRRVTVSRVRVDPFTLTLTAADVRIYERDGRTVFFGLSRLLVDVEARSLVRRALVVRELRLDSPRVRIVRERLAPSREPLAGYNFSDVAARLRGPPGARAERTAPRFSFANVRVVDGAASYDDRPTASRHEIEGLELGVPFVSTIPTDADVFVQPELRMRIDGTPLEIVARGRPFARSGESTARVRITSLDIPHWLPIVPVRLPVDIVSARLDVALEATFLRGGGPSPTLALNGTVALTGVDVRAEGAPLARLERLDVALRRVELPGAAIFIEKVSIGGLDLRARRERDGTLDWARLLRAPRSSERTSAAVDLTGMPRIEIGEVTLASASVRLRDEALRPPSEVVVAPIDLRLRGISTAPGARSAVTLALRGKPGGTVRAEGTLSLEPPTAAGSLSIDVSEPGRLVPYFRDILAVDVPSGRMRASGRFRFEARPGGPRVVFSGISLDVAKLAVRGAGEGTFLRVPRFEARDTSIDVERRSVSIGPVTSRGGWVEIRREANGKLRLARLLRRSRDKPVGPDLPWTVHFARIDLSDWRGRYEDLHVTPPVHVTASGLAIRSTGLEVSPGWEGAGEVDVNIGDGSVHVAGSADIDPIALAFRVDVKDAPISPFQGYFARYVGALFTAGTVSAQARLALALVRKPVRDLRLDIAGNASLTGVAAVDAREGKPLVRWNALHLSGVSLKLLPLRLTVGDVTLEQPVVRIARGTDGTMNLGPFGKRDTARLEPKAVASTPRPRPVIAIGQVAVKGGRLFFADGAVRPPFIGELGHVEARITGLATDPRSRAAFELRSGVNRAAALGASGTLSVLAGPPSADARLGVRDLDLPPFSSYAAKYAGALVDKGKLDLSATCRIERGKLDVQSRLVIDQLQLSVAPQSPKAPRLQVRDAVALLKDRRGVIDLSVPVTGSLSDPSFRLGPAIQRAMGNVVTRVVTAPFALLGAAFGGSGREELSVVEFAPGAWTLDDAAEQKLQALNKALHERPGLSFEIEGAADPTRDRGRLTRYLLEHGLWKGTGDVVSEEALIALARRRAAAVRDALARAQPDAARRLFLMRPKVAKDAGSRVRLLLKPS